MDIVISVNNNEEVMILPIVPPDIEIDKPWENSEKDSLKYGKIKLIGLPGLTSFSIESFFPVNKNYNFQKNGSEKDGRKYLVFFEKWRAKRVPFRVVITDKQKSELLNLPMAIDGFKYSFDKVGDVKYSLSFQEYKFIK